jgi:hypothetical protein
MSMTNDTGIEDLVTWGLRIAAELTRRLERRHNIWNSAGICRDHDTTEFKSAVAKRSQDYAFFYQIKNHCCFWCEETERQYNIDWRIYSADDGR